MQSLAFLQSSQIMITMSTPLVVLVAALVINTPSYCSAEYVYCVTPTTTSCSFCPYDSRCATLSEYAQNAELFFTSNTTIVFLPGDHALNTNITVTNIARLAMYGESSSGNIANIVCNGSVGFSFTSMKGDFRIYSLTFTSCGRKYGTPSASNYALLLQTTQYAELVNCSFHDNLGTALVLNNTNITLAGNSVFTHNHCESTSCVGGGGIVALSSNITFTGNTSFLENFATSSEHYRDGGGAIHALNNTVLSFKGTSYFISNYADRGSGAIYTFNAALNFIGISNFINNSALFGGGAIKSHNTVVNFNGTNDFINNSALFGGGAITTSHNTVLSFNGTNNFINNSVVFGSSGAITTSDNTVLSFNGTSNFINNSANGNGGGAISASDNTVLSFNGINNFNNSAGYDGGAIYTSDNTVLSFNGTNSFINNSAGYGGAISTSENTAFTFNGTSDFINNSAEYGGAIYTSENTALSFNGTSNFTNNWAHTDGGAIYTSHNNTLSFNGTSSFISNSATGNGGAMYTIENVTISFNGTSNFFTNSAGGGGAIFASNNAVLDFNGTINFIKNLAGYFGGGACYASINAMLSFSGGSNFSNNSATVGGAIFVNATTTLVFSGSVSFTNNGEVDNEYRGTVYGGGMCIWFTSTFSILPNTAICWENNQAIAGGAIYVFDANPLTYCTSAAIYTPKEQCFFQLPGQNLSNIDVQLIFINNSAVVAGSVLYGGAIDNCQLTGLESYGSGEVFNMVVHIDGTDYNSNISSDPLYIRPCEYNHLVPSSVIKHNAYPGETFQVSVVAVGQRNGAVPSTVRSITTKDQGNLQDYQYLRKTNTCTKLNYTVFSLSRHVSVDLHAECGPCLKFGNVHELSIKVTLNQTCPPGFHMSEIARSCVCEPRLARYIGTLKCSITNGLAQITRDLGEQLWVGYDSQSGGLILHPHCPFDYCISHAVEFSLNNTDKQCAYHKTGLLCGACKQGYSLVLGTHHCEQCTNRRIVLLIPFAVMGVALVFLLLVCKLTVAAGTISGLVFYANVIGANRTTFLPVKSTDPLSVFVAWINFDFGIETCFYNGMDVYSKTWLQFVFPAYIWVIVGLVIAISHFSRRFSNLLGNNPVSVLATLILLSYTKLLRTLITVMYVTYLEYPTYNRRVWLYDANIDYLSAKHIPLFLVAMLVFLLLFLPYTLLLLFGQWLQAISHLRLFSWVNSARLKPFMDSYHAPYKAKHRYWPGLLLVLRFALLLVFALNLQQNTSINMLAILVGSGILHLWAWISGGVYKKWCLDAIEGSFVLNLIILAAATYHVQLSGGDQLAVGYTSVSIALVTFTGVLAYHIFQQLRHTKLWKRVPKPNLRCSNLNVTFNQVVNKPINSPTVQISMLDKLRESLLEDQPQQNL